MPTTTNLVAGLATALALLQPTSATCSSFQLLVSYAGISGASHGLTTRISAGYACPAGTLNATACTARGEPTRLELLRFFRQTNLSEETYAALYPVVGANWTSGSWTERIVGEVSNAAGVSIDLRRDDDDPDAENRTAGYMTFSPSLDCREGVVSGCEDGFEVQDETVVELCQPVVREDDEGAKRFWGAIEWVETEVEEAERLRGVSPETFVQASGNGSTTNPDPVPAEETEDGEGKGVRGSPGVWLLAGTAMLSLAFVL